MSRKESNLLVLLKNILKVKINIIDYFTEAYVELTKRLETISSILTKSEGFQKNHK